MSAALDYARSTERLTNQTTTETRQQAAEILRTITSSTTAFTMSRDTRRLLRHTVKQWDAA